jgi:GntR family transcriptional regulator
VPPRYRYEEIADDLRKRIEAGEFPMQILRVLGVTETLAGVGVFVRDSSSEA